MKAAIAPSVALPDLLRQACATLQALGRAGSLRERKLSAKAFSLEAAENSGSNLKRLLWLRDQIEGRQAPTRVDDLRQTLRNMERFAQSPNVTSPPRELRTLRHLYSVRTQAEEGDALKTNIYELFALACLNASERHPEDFGFAKSSKAVRYRLAELTSKRDDLFAQIAASYSSAEAQRITGGAVAPEPSGTLPARLVAWAMSSAF